MSPPLWFVMLPAWLWRYRWPLGVIYGGLVLILLAVRYTRHHPSGAPRSEDAHLATRKELRALDSKRGPGIVLGMSSRHHAAIIYAPAQHNVLLFGEPGIGKSAQNVYNTAVCWNGGLVYIDLKGNGYRLTRRARALRGPVAVWAPGIPSIVSDRFNPLHLMRWGSRHGETADVDRLAYLVVNPAHPPRSAEAESYQRAPRQVVSLVALYTHYARGLDCSLPGMRAFMTSAQDIKRLLDAMAALGHPKLRAGVNALLQATGTRLSAVWEAALEWLAPYDDPALIDTMSDTTIPWAQLQHGPAPLTWYIRVSAVDMHGRLQAPVRLILEQVFYQLMARDSTDHDFPVLVIVDDAAELDRMAIMLVVAEFGREYGIHIMLIFQSPLQVWDTYGHEVSLFETCQTWVIHRLGHPDSEEFISRKSGQRMVHEPQETTSHMSGSWRRRYTSGERVLQQRLFLPHEIDQLRQGEMLICSDGLKIKAVGINGLTDARFRPWLGDTAEGDGSSSAWD